MTLRTTFRTLALAVGLVLFAPDHLAAGGPATEQAGRLLPTTTLRAALPARVADLRLHAADAAEVDQPGLRATFATARYAAGLDGAGVELKVTDLARMPELVALARQWADREVNTEANGRRTRTGRVAGQPALYSWDESTGVGRIEVLVNGRVLVAADTRSLGRHDLGKVARDLPIPALVAALD